MALIGLAGGRVPYQTMDLSLVLSKGSFRKIGRLSYDFAEQDCVCLGQRHLNEHLFVQYLSVHGWLGSGVLRRCASLTDLGYTDAKSG